MNVHRGRTGVFAMLLVAGLAACGDSPGTGPEVVDPDRDPSLEAGRPASHTLEWNAMARALVASRHVDPPRASRVYALLAVAQHATLVAAAGPGDAPGASRNLSLGAALSAASAEVLRRLVPGDASSIAAFEQQSIDALVNGGVLDQDITAGQALGQQVADRVLQHASSDRSGARWTGTVPTGEGAWYGATPGTLPLLPAWKDVRTWLLESPSQFLPPPPPAYGSAEFLEALAEVRRIADTRTEEQLWIAHYWADAPGSHTPPGHWNRIATILMARNGLSEREVTRNLALLNMALMDAGIACWDAKYEYWVLRPWQADPGILVPLMKPNFPAYVSGHASFSGAASEFLSALFPADAADLRAMAEEAAASRLYGGIHYRFDNVEGLKLGRRIGELAVATGARPDAAAPWARYVR